MFLIACRCVGVNGLGRLFLSSLEEIMMRGREARMVLTTRDPTIALLGKVFQIKPRDPRGKESRNILLRHAQQDKETKFSVETEQAITKLLDACQGLPVAHSVVGRGVLQCTMRSNVGPEDAWRLYLSNQGNIIEETAGRYASLFSIFAAALSSLDEEEMFKNGGEKQGNNRKYSYREMHRSLCVLLKQQRAPVYMLGCLWDMNEEAVKEVCKNLVRAGLAEWYYEGINGSQEVECISIHDLLHDFATKQAEKEENKNEWHTRVVEGYSRRIGEHKSKKKECREWWKIEIECIENDGGYMLRNFKSTLVSEFT